MKLNRTTILALFVAAHCISTACAGDSVVVAAQETEAAVAPRAAHLRLINLPQLEFGLRAAIKCTGTAESLTLSVADTVTTLNEEAINGERSAEVLLTVPASQLALAASRKFCLKDDAASTNELLVPGLATAHASLRCRNKDSVTVHFASAPLQVKLLCIRPLTEDQDSSLAK